VQSKKGKRANTGVSIAIKRKYKKYISNWNFITRVEAGSNTSTVTL
jgi:hypothetical protein